MAWCSIKHRDFTYLYTTSGSIFHYRDLEDKQKLREVTSELIPMFKYASTDQISRRS
jgi:hypothetical protein